MSTTDVTSAAAAVRYPAVSDEVVCIKHPMRAGYIEKIERGIITVRWTSHRETDAMTHIQWAAAFDWRGNGWYLAA